MAYNPKLQVIHTHTLNQDDLTATTGGKLHEVELRIPEGQMQFIGHY